MAKRRLNHEGSLTLRKDGLWVGRISHEGSRIAAYTVEPKRRPARSCRPSNRNRARVSPWSHLPCLSGSIWRNDWQM